MWNYQTLGPGPFIFSLHAKSAGAFGDTTAVGWIVINGENKRLEEGYLTCSLDKAKSSREDKLKINSLILSQLQPTKICKSTEDLIKEFYYTWIVIKNKYPQIHVIGSGHCPIETRFFAKAIKKHSLKPLKESPLPFHELKTALLIAGMDLANYPRFDTELPMHHPFSDSAYSARLFHEAIKIMSMRQQLFSNNSLKPVQQEKKDWHIFSIDAETNGLYGQHFALAWTVRNQKGAELEKNYLACPLDQAKGNDNSADWVIKNVIPVLPKTVNCDNPKKLIQKFYDSFIHIIDKYPNLRIISGNHFPVETRLFAKAFKRHAPKEAQNQFPVLIHELSTALLLTGINRADFPRDANEQQTHNPYCDAVYTARLFSEALNKSSILNAAPNL